MTSVYISLATLSRLPWGKCTERETISILKRFISMLRVASHLFFICSVSDGAESFKSKIAIYVRKAILREDIFAR